MSQPPITDPRVAAFPPALRELLDAELAAGNTIVEIASCFPAPPAGAYVKLAGPVTTRARESTAALSFYDRNSSIYSGEWTDAKRFYFLLEPPRPPEPEPDMDAIRARGAGAGPTPLVQRPAGVYPSISDISHAELGIRERASFQALGRVRQFEASMVIDYEKWHDGIGYDLALLNEATAEERQAIEDLLIRRGAEDWRDVEALAALKTERAEKVLRLALHHGNAEIRGAVVHHAPHLVDESRKIEHLVEALRTAVFYGGLTQALAEVETFHPPEVVDELFFGALNRDGDGPVHFAGMLLFLHGKARVPFDWDHRPFLLRFNTTDRKERRAVFKELCERIGVDPARYLKRRGKATRPRGKKR